MMKGSIIRVAISVLMLFVLYSCKGIAEEEQQSDPVPAVLGLDIVLSTATGDGDVPERERVKELKLPKAPNYRNNSNRSSNSDYSLHGTKAEAT